MGWEQDGLGCGAILPSVSAHSTWWMDTDECGGRGGAEKVVYYSVVTGKRNMSKVSPGLGWCQNAKICHTTVYDSMVVKTWNSHC